MDSKNHWDQWAKSVGEITERQIARIKALVTDDDKHQKGFETFLRGLQKNINPGITHLEAIEMLSQHIITRPVFEALFEHYSFVQHNAISQSMQTMLDLLEAQAIEKDTKILNNFYESVKMRASGIDNAEGKQRIIIELYDKFFKTAFPKMVERLGIVYTPVEVVDFIIHSVNDVLKKEFDRSISDENVHVLDPFSGTGTFITRLLQSGLIHKKDLLRKYQHEIHANEIVLLAYYIAAVNIENAFHDAMGDPEYTAFDGICVTDTFQLGEAADENSLFSEMFPQNSIRVQRQMKAPLSIIMGNPPYSIGQKSANDNAQNQAYPRLDAKIASTYAAASSAGLSKSLYDPYIKAFRWSTDRLAKTGGIMCFVSNGKWIEGNSLDGFRKTIEKEFSSIYIFDLRGDQRTSGELSKKEGGKIFGSGSRSKITITLLVKDPSAHKEKATIFYHDIGDYLSREEKLSAIKQATSTATGHLQWEVLNPNEHGDWLSLRNNSFDSLIPFEPAKKFDNFSISLFTTYAIGVATNRDAWVTNFSRSEVENNVRKMIDFYNQQRTESAKESDPTKISWTRALRKDLDKGIIHHFKPHEFRTYAYRPFTRQRLYFDKPFIESPGLSSRLFVNEKTKNLAICVTGIGSNKGFSALMVDTIPDIQLIMNGQVFPLYYFEERQKQKNSLFDDNGAVDPVRKDGISDYVFARAKKEYGNNITKEDIFYYVYGFLHSPIYKAAFENDLKKMLPRLPLVEDVRDFWAFSNAGRKLAELHVNYETVPAHKGVEVTGTESNFFTVDKMHFGSKTQKDKILYNSHITVSNIPETAYDYIVNGKSAIEWVMERYAVTTYKESGIKNDPNDWANETGNPKYILDLLLSVINVSVQTMAIVNDLPKIAFA
jgi:predicted helicase